MPRADTLELLLLLLLLLSLECPTLPSAPESVKYGSETCESQSLQFELKYQYRVPLFTIYSCSVEI